MERRLFLVNYFKIIYEIEDTVNVASAATLKSNHLQLHQLRARTQLYQLQRIAQQFIEKAAGFLKRKLGNALEGNGWAAAMYV